MYDEVLDIHYLILQPELIENVSFEEEDKKVKFLIIYHRKLK